MISNHWISIPHHDSQPLAQISTSWFTVICWASGCKSWWAMLCQWFWIMLRYAEPVVVYHGVLCWASGESWCANLSQWLWIMVSYADPVVANHCVLCWATLAQHSSPWFTTTSSAYHTMIHNHWLSIAHHDSQPLAQISTPWFTTGTA
jgi:hypothetical protein